MHVDLTRIIKDIISDINYVHQDMKKMWYYEELFGGYGTVDKILYIRNTLEGYLINPETIFTEDNEVTFDVLVSKISTILPPYSDEIGWNEILGAFGNVELLISRLREQIPSKNESKELLSNNDIINVNLEHNNIFLPYELPTELLIEKLGSNPNEWHRIGFRKFEEVLAEIWNGMGWETMLTPPTRDGGFDIRAIRNKNGIMACYLLEAKAFNPMKPVGVQIVRNLYGVVEKQKASHGIIATTSFFTKDAQKEANALKYRLSLADFNTILSWVEKYKTFKKKK